MKLRTISSVNFSLIYRISDSWSLFIIPGPWVLTVNSPTLLILMTASWYVVAKLLTVSIMSKVDYRNKVLPCVLASLSCVWDLVEISSERGGIILSYLSVQTPPSVNVCWRMMKMLSTCYVWCFFHRSVCVCVCVCVSDDNAGGFSQQSVRPAQ